MEVTELENDHFRKRANRGEDHMNIPCQTRLTRNSHYGQRSLCGVFPLLGQP